jgi:hypothetical protein
MSKSAVDAPLRQDVLQIDLPVSTSKIVEHSIDPRTQLEPDLKAVIHGVAPVKFLQKKETNLPSAVSEKVKSDHADALNINKTEKTEKVVEKLAVKVDTTKTPEKK